MFASSRYLAFVAAFFAILALYTVGSAEAISCLDENGNEVDWWIILKSPNLETSSAQEGLAYVYIDEKTQESKKLVLSRSNVNDKSSALGATLTQIYTSRSKSDTGYVMYNDETPDGKVSTSKAHAKGVIAFDEYSGFWLVHSAPQFPYPFTYTSVYSYPKSASTYGQSFLCVSYDTKVFDLVARQLQFADPLIYDHNLPDRLADIAPTVRSLIDGTKQSGSSIQPLFSHGGITFTSFSKNKDWNQDLYNSLVEPHLKQGMFIETWMRPYQPACCAPECLYDSVNVAIVSLTYELTFKETKDHSKWAIAQADPWVCVGDINRNVSQWKRGGGTVCVHNANVYAAFKYVVAQVNQTCTA
eukprot:GEZU01005292.1.p1 GENE.GEZU01005292.1~~GEZU01005292.1.p1  ORF type:complete len:358 (+),score=57.79 GEZU01005292.1:178-1251(+)